MERADLTDMIDELLDLQHDLGKYILLPLSFLPRDADADLVRAALRRALFETHKGPSGVRSARAIWTAFESSMAAPLEGYPGLGLLRAAVEGALAWEVAARGDDAIDRERVTADLGAVMPAVRNLIDEVNRDR